jgi:hypothetical protein
VGHPDHLSQVERQTVEAEAMHKTRQFLEKSGVSGGTEIYTVTVDSAVDSECRSPSHATEAAMERSVAEGTDSGRLDHQVLAEIEGMGSETGERLALESCKSPARLAKVPTAVRRCIPL